MKTSNKYIALAALAMTLAACTQEEEFAPQGEPQEITILTRAANSETFTGDFTLELWNDGVRTTHQMTYTDGTGWNAVKVDKLGTTVTALAHCGNTVNVTASGGYSIALTEDQSTKEDFLAADVMTATGTVDQNGVLSLNFKHYFSKVTFKVTLADEFKTETESGTALTPITNLHVVTKDSSTPTVTAYCSATDSDADYHYDCSAYIPAGTYAIGDTFVKVNIKDNQLVAKMQRETTLAAGTHCTFYLKVGKNKVTITQVTTNTIVNPFSGGWDNDSETDLN